mmetsp:Transcript_14293/g.21604  ORF Transcript_14293/g.21604 Transcript_14293/m.21604 type:complete len:131 (+) Transcript_14293:19-411(+)
MNRPPTSDLLDDESVEKEVLITRSGKMKNTNVYKIMKEDHTLGSMLTQELLENNAMFAGYINPHPFEHFINIRVQTDDNKSPDELIIDSIASLKGKIQNIEEAFDKALKNFTGDSDMMQHDSHYSDSRWN